MKIFALMLVCAASGVARGQDVHGVVHDNHAQPLREVAITLADTAGHDMEEVRTDERGRFRIALADAGRYRISAKHIGYEPWRSPSIDASVARDVAIDVELKAIPVEMLAVVVRAQRDTLIRERIFGMDIRGMGGSVITNAEIAVRVATGASFLDIVKSASPSWIAVRGGGNSNGCVSNLGGGCITVLLDGMTEIDAQLFNTDLVPGWVDHIVFIRGTEAAALFGSKAQNGAMLVYSHAASRQN